MRYICDKVLFLSNNYLFIKLCVMYCFVKRRVYFETTRNIEKRPPEGCPNCFNRFPNGYFHYTLPYAPPFSLPHPFLELPSLQKTGFRPCRANLDFSPPCGGARPATALPTCRDFGCQTLKQTSNISWPLIQWINSCKANLLYPL